VKVKWHLFMVLIWFVQINLFLNDKFFFLVLGFELGLVLARQVLYHSHHVVQHVF
jgi:hypothetical protein